MNNEVEEGIQLLESMWYVTAVKIVEMAIQVYGLNQEQANALKDIFLRQNDYFVVLKD